jgi:general secretion pathway protein L
MSRTADGLLSAQLAAARVEDINIVLTGLQNAGFTITATSQQDPSGRTLADITVRP